MSKPRVSEEEFIELVETYGVRGVARRLKQGERSVYRRRERIEARLGRQIKSPDAKNTRRADPIRGRLEYALSSGVVLVGSDAHYWPHRVSCAHRAFVHFCKELKPKMVVVNGDMIDGASISRWPSGINIDHRPSVVQEIETCQERLGEIEAAAKNAKRIWPLGNHDARFEARLGAMAPEFAGVHGYSLKDHFPYWQPCFSVWINELVIKHRWKGGIHARHNNVKEAGYSMCTGHLHRLGTTIWTNLRGDCYGSECGTMADIYGDQFEYLEDNPRNWQAGFMVFTFRDTKLMHPEPVRVVDEETVEFRGEHITV